MGRKRKAHGTLHQVEGGKPVRLTISHQKFPPFVRPAPRGKTGNQHAFTATIKELAPFVHAFIVGELKSPGAKRHPGLTAVIKEWRKVSMSQGRPRARDLAAFTIERAFKGAWEVWGVKAPFSEGETDSFWRRYVLGHPRALRDFREILREPLPWSRDHRGHWIKYFFGAPGTAAREFNLLTKAPTSWTVITLREEEEL